MSSNNTSLESVSVSSIMITDVKTAEEHQSVKTVCRLLYENKIDSIVVITKTTPENHESKIPVGIVTERDIVRLVSLPDIPSIDEPVYLLLRAPLITINPNSSIIDAMENMQQKDIRRLPIVDNKGKLLGIVTDKDIFRVILKNQALASVGTTDQIPVDQQPIYGRFTDYWLRGLSITP
jgi:CBS domain-containing protein